jgi:F0F1-type ATP synthase, subunit b
MRTSHRFATEKLVSRISSHSLFVAVITMLCIGFSSLPALAQDHPAPSEKASAASSDAHHDSHEGSHDDGHGDAHGGGHGHGEYSFWADLPFWSLIAFIGFVAAIKGLGLWDLLLNNMSEREKAELNAIAAAESLLDQARNELRQAKGRIESLDETIRETLAEAQRDAETTRAQIQAVAQREAQAAVDRATLEITRVRDQSLDEIFETLSSKVADLTEARLRSDLQSDDHDRLISSMLEELAIR